MIFHMCMCVLCLHVSMLSRPRLSPWLKINTDVFLKVINVQCILGIGAGNVLNDNVISETVNCYM